MTVSNLRPRTSLLLVMLACLAATATRAQPNACTADFKGTSATYQACNETVAPDVSAYWSLLNDGKTIRTLLVGRVNEGGFVAWGWFSPQMPGTTAAVAYATAGSATVVPYFLADRNGDAVRPNNTVPLSNTDAEVDAAGKVRAIFEQDVQATGDVPALWAVGPGVDATTGTLAYHGRLQRGGHIYNLAASGTDATPTPTPTASTPAAQSPSPAAATPTATPSESPAPCVGAHHLSGLAGDALVFASHRRADVLCDASGSCATRGHVVTFRGAPMTMRSYCAAHASCAARRMLVNSPRMARGLRVESATDGLLFTPLSARFESRVEETLLCALVRVGM